MGLQMTDVPPSQVIGSTFDLQDERGGSTTIFRSADESDDIYFVSYQSSEDDEELSEDHFFSPPSSSTSKEAVVAAAPYDPFVIRRATPIMDDEEDEGDLEETVCSSVLSSDMSSDMYLDRRWSLEDEDMEDFFELACNNSEQRQTTPTPPPKGQVAEETKKADVTFDAASSFQGYNEREETNNTNVVSSSVPPLTCMDNEESNKTTTLISYIWSMLYRAKNEGISFTFEAILYAVSQHPSAKTFSAAVVSGMVLFAILML